MINIVLIDTTLIVLFVLFFDLKLFTLDTNAKDSKCVAHIGDSTYFLNVKQEHIQQGDSHGEHAHCNAEQVSPRPSSRSLEMQSALERPKASTTDSGRSGTNLFMLLRCLATSHSGKIRIR